jgi:hypothetical protein
MRSSIRNSPTPPSGRGAVRELIDLGPAVFNRRIGSNESAAMLTAQAYAMAQWEYFDGDDRDRVAPVGCVAD